MLLAEALELGGPGIVTFIGAGGKTTAIYSLARELRPLHPQIIITTTTKMYLPREGETEGLFIEPQLDVALCKLRDGFATRRIVAIGRSASPEGKLLGISTSWVPVLSSAFPKAIILIEGDGANRKPFKAPGNGEPVIPSSTTMVVATVGLDVIGQPLEPQHVHRPEIVARLAGIEMGDLVTEEVIIKVLLSPHGLARGTPHDAVLIALLNKAETEERIESGRYIASQLLIGPEEESARMQGAMEISSSHFKFNSVIITTLQSLPPVKEVYRR